MTKVTLHVFDHGCLKISLSPALRTNKNAGIDHFSYL